LIWLVVLANVVVWFAAGVVIGRIIYRNGRR